MAKKNCNENHYQISNITRQTFDEYVAETIYHFWQICRENVIHIFGVHVAKNDSRSFGKYVAICLRYLSGKFLLSFLGLWLPELIFGRTAGTGSRVKILSTA